MAHRRARPKYIDDPRSTDELVRLLLNTEDEDAHEDIVHALQRRGDAGVFSAACALCESADSEERETGVCILSQNMVAEKTLRRQSIPVLLELLKKETQPDVLAGLGHAFGHLKATAAVRPLRRIRNHPDADVRYGVVHGLWTQASALAIKTLIELTADKEDRVRDWATFGIGQMIDNDTPEIREALVRRLNDPHSVTRGEALRGLAQRKDERVIEPLIAALTADRVGPLAIEAAQETRDPRLLPALMELQSWWGADDTDLQEAIKSCTPEVTLHIHADPPVNERVCVS